jgi:phenylalanyl-tRNA synthetase beta chain
VRERFGLEARVFAAEIDLDRLGGTVAARAAALPRFPGATRDLSFFVEAEVPHAAVRGVLTAASPLLAAVRVLDDYREPGRVPAGKKGLLYSLLYRAADRTLTDEEVAREHERVVAALRSRFAIEPR